MCFIFNCPKALKKGKKKKNFEKEYKLKFHFCPPVAPPLKDTSKIQKFSMWEFVNSTNTYYNIMTLFSVAQIQNTQKIID